MRALRPLVAITAAAAALAWAGPAAALQITEAALPQTQTGLQAIAPGPDGNMWFTEGVRAQFGRITPTMAVKDFSSGCGITIGSFPWGITAGPDGGVWFAEHTLNRVARADPVNCSVKEYSTGISAGQHPRWIITGPDGNLWFTGDLGIGRVTPAGVTTEFPLQPGWSPAGPPIFGPDGRIWFVEYNQAQGAALGAMTTAGAVGFLGTGGSSRGDGVPARGADGTIWFAEYDRVEHVMADGHVELTSLPAGVLSPDSLTLGPDGNLWFDEQGRQKLGSIAPDGTITEHPASFDGGTGATFVAAGPGRQLWALDGAGDRIARVRLDPAATTGDVAFPGGAVTATGTVDPYASTTTWQFQYGTTTAYGRATPALTVPPGPGPVTVSAALSGLAGNAVYHYRLVATSAAGTTTGADRTLATFGLSVPGGGAATDHSGPRMRIAGTRLRLGRDGRVPLVLRCPLTEPSGCRGTLRLASAARVRVGSARRIAALGTASFRAAGGRAVTVHVRVPRAGRLLVARRDGLRARVTVRARDASGNAATTTRLLPLRPAGR